MNADSTTKRRDYAAVPPLVCQFTDAILHGDRHLNACQRVVLHTKRRRIAKEHDYGVANVFIDGGAVLQREFRHFSEVVIEKLREVFRLHFIGDLSEPDQIGKANRELLALADDFNILLAGEDRVIDLRRQIFRELGRESG
jgi:hypothetical protein